MGKPPADEAHPVSNLYIAIEAEASKRPTAAAFECHDGTTFTFAEMVKRVGDRSAALASLGVAQGDRVTVQVEKSIENVWLYLATLRIGAVYVPLNTAYTAAELEYFFADARPRLIVGRANARSSGARTCRSRCAGDDAGCNRVSRRGHAGRVCAPAGQCARRDRLYIWHDR
ncbi:MAG: AMP-binding protein [Gammaproteobacteria bacterium]|nr:AMP-binding protein [Gammaproteobacteria bacterium]